MLAHTPFQSACLDYFGSGGRLRLAEPLARHGTFAVGGPAEVWLGAAYEDDLRAIVTLARDHALPVMFVGNGTNVLYADAGARGAVVRASLEQWEIRDVDDLAGSATLVAGAGVSLPKLVNELAALGWAGLEWGAGVPGTIGGAVVSNAGCHGQSIGDTIDRARICDLRTGEILELGRADLGLAYRHSRFRSTRRVPFGPDGRPIPPPREPIDPLEIITGATFRLQRDDPAAIRARIAYYKKHRRDTQPPQPSAGSVFKNPTGDYAGRLIEAAGLRGHQSGQAAISARHANFIVNLGGATARDIVDLIALAHTAVLDQFGVDLELEVEPRGDWEMK